MNRTNIVAGFSPMSVFINKGVRSEPASTFLKPAMERPNLHVLTSAHVTRVPKYHHKSKQNINLHLYIIQNTNEIKRSSYNHL